MMDVLYKGKTLEGLWIEGVAFPHDNNGEVTMFYQHPMDGSLEGKEVIPESVGQYFGMQDRNKTKIFTGDIAIGPCNAKVFFYYDKAELQYKAKSMDSDKSFELRSDLGQVFEIVGNIFDEEDKDGTR